MPWMAVETAYAFEGPAGKASLLDLFDGRRQLIVYRAFFEPGVFGWPEHACRGCSMVADQVAHIAHLNARDTTLVFVSRAPQADIARLKARMGWEIPWFTVTDRFDADFGVDEWHGTNVFYRDGRPRVPHLLPQQSRRRADGRHLELPRHHAAGPAGGLGGLAGGLSPDADLQVVELARQLRSRMRRRTRSGSRCRMPERRRFGIRTWARSREPGRRAWVCCLPLFDALRLPTPHERNSGTHRRSSAHRPPCGLNPRSSRRPFRGECSASHLPDLSRHALQLPESAIPRFMQCGDIARVRLGRPC